ncbi:MAG: mersacidin/lichenicidin family type 2 lantibiotic [Acidobacteriota bacterium]
MKKIDIARALRDPEYRSGLTAEEQATLPTHPAGVADLADDALRTVAGGCGPGTPGWTTWIESCIPPGSNAQCP